MDRTECMSCGDLYDRDLLNEFVKCRDCVATQSEGLDDCALDHECGWCGKAYREGAHFYDDTCNTCARQHGLEVPRDWMSE